MTIDNVQKHNICINVSSSQTVRPCLQSFRAFSPIQEVLPVGRRLRFSGIHIRPEPYCPIVSIQSAAQYFQDPIFPHDEPGGDDSLDKSIQIGIT
jgi:hypothetical protein